MVKVKKRGRPRIIVGEADTLPQIRVEKKIADAFRERCTTTGITIAYLRRDAYKQFVDGVCSKCKKE